MLFRALGVEVRYHGQERGDSQRSDIGMDMHLHNECVGCVGSCWASRRGSLCAHERGVQYIVWVGVVVAITITVLCNGLAEEETHRVLKNMSLLWSGNSATQASS
jgi:hypothetical protein